MTQQFRNIPLSEYCPEYNCYQIADDRLIFITQGQPTCVGEIHQVASVIQCERDSDNRWKMSNIANIVDSHGEISILHEVPIWPLPEYLSQVYNNEASGLDPVSELQITHKCSLSFGRDTKYNILDILGIKTPVDNITEVLGQVDVGVAD